MNERPFNRVNVVVVDGVGCGAAHDARTKFPKDVGSNSLAHASLVEKIDAPALQEMGLEYIPGLEEMQTVSHVDLLKVRGAYGSLNPTYTGKGSPEGHQALMGHIVTVPYLTFDETRIPDDVIALVEASVHAVTGRDAKAIRYPGTDDVSGTKFIETPGIGDRHLTSLDPQNILYVPTYASSDSLVQIALHQSVVPQELIEQIGKELRRKIDEAGLRIGRVIMRPFIGDGPTGPNKFTRVGKDRRDYGVDPDGPTLIDYLSKAGIKVRSVGKAADMLNKRGFLKENCEKLKTDDQRINRVFDLIRTEIEPVLIFTNLISTDEDFGHRRDPRGYVLHIKAMDRVIQEIKAAMTDRDLLIVTSDHGCDPTWGAHTNHTFEEVLMAAYSPRMRGRRNLGRRASFADVAATVAENFGIRDRLKNGESFLQELLAA